MRPAAPCNASLMTVPSNWLGLPLPLRGFAPPSRSSFRKFWIFCISPLRIGVEYDSLYTMKTQMPKKDRDELLKRLAALVPFAKGSVCVSHKPCGNPWKCKKCLSGEMHPSVQYSFRENGKLRTMHVQPRFLKQVQEAVANGREVERLLVEAGKKYIGFLRTQE